MNEARDTVFFIFWILQKPQVEQDFSIIFWQILSKIYNSFNEDLITSNVIMLKSLIYNLQLETPELRPGQACNL